MEKIESSFEESKESIKDEKSEPKFVYSRRWITLSNVFETVPFRIKDLLFIFVTIKKYQYYGKGLIYEKEPDNFVLLKDREGNHRQIFYQSKLILNPSSQDA